MDTSEIRLSNLRHLLGSYPTQKEFSRAVGMSVQYLNSLLKQRQALGEKTARKIELALSLEPGWLDRDVRDSQRVSSSPAGLVEMDQELVHLALAMKPLTPKVRVALQALVDALTEPV